MTNYSDMMLPITQGQAEKIAREIKKGSPFSIRISGVNLQEPGTLPVGLTPTQSKKVLRAKEKGVGVVINISKTQLDAMRRSGSGIFDILKTIEKGFKGTKKLTDSLIANPIRKALDKTGKTTDNEFSFTKGFTRRGGRSIVDEAYIEPAEDIINRMQGLAPGDMSGVQTYEVPKVSKKKPQNQAGKGLWTSGSQQF